MSEAADAVDGEANVADVGSLGHFHCYHLQSQLSIDLQIEAGIRRY